MPDAVLSGLEQRPRRLKRIATLETAGKLPALRGAQREPAIFGASPTRSEARGVDDQGVGRSRV